jgi:glucose-1-phosphate adenylyltransferase
VSNSIVADGCVVKGTVTGSILFPGVTVERGAVVRDSIVFPFTRIGAGARVTKAILDKFARVGEGASIGGRPGPAGTAQKAVSPGRQPDTGTDIAVVGRQARILQGVTVSAGALVEPHTISRTRRKRR